MTTINDQMRSSARQLVNNMWTNMTGLLAVVVATVDGFDVASEGHDGTDPARIAAMASSISAIGSVVGQEFKLGQSKTITVNSEHGFAYLSSVARHDVPLVIIIIADNTAILGQIAYRCGEVIKRLEPA